MKRKMSALAAILFVGLLALGLVSRPVRSADDTRFAFAEFRIQFDCACASDGGWEQRTPIVDSAAVRRNLPVNQRPQNRKPFLLSYRS